MASASRLAMACFNASRVLSSWTLPSVALYSPSASSTVLSSFDDSTALTAACSVFASAFTLLAVLSALAVASSRPVLSDASHLTMAGVSAPTARLSASRVFASFTAFTSVFNAAVVASAPSSVRYESTAFFWAATAEPHAPRATETLWSSQARYPHTPPTARTTATAAATPTMTRFPFLPVPAGWSLTASDVTLSSMRMLLRFVPMGFTPTTRPRIDIGLFTGFRHACGQAGTPTRRGSGPALPGASHPPWEPRPPNRRAIA